MQTRVQKWGNSLAVRLPRSFAREVGIDQDAPVDLVIERGRLVLVPVAPAVPTLDELLEQVTPENLHGEVDTGPAVGDEAW